MKIGKKTHLPMNNLHTPAPQHPHNVILTGLQVGANLIEMVASIQVPCQRQRPIHLPLRGDRVLVTTVEKAFDYPEGDEATDIYPLELRRVLHTPFLQSKTLGQGCVELQEEGEWNARAAVGDVGLTLFLQTGILH